MPLVAQSLTITHPLPWKGPFYYDTMHKAARQILKRRLDNGEVNEPFIYWPRSFLIKEWGRRWMRWRSSFKLHITPAAQQPCQHNWQEQARCTVCHCPLWLLIPSGSLPLSHHFPGTAFSSLYQPGSRCAAYRLLRLRPANSSWFLLVFPLC